MAPGLGASAWAKGHQGRIRPRGESKSRGSSAIQIVDPSTVTIQASNISTAPAKEHEQLTFSGSQREKASTAIKIVDPKARVNIPEVNHSVSTKTEVKVRTPKASVKNASAIPIITPLALDIAVPLADGSEAIQVNTEAAKPSHIVEQRQSAEDHGSLLGWSSKAAELVTAMAQKVDEVEILSSNYKTDKMDAMQLKHDVTIIANKVEPAAIEFAKEMKPNATAEFLAILMRSDMFMGCDAKSLSFLDILPPERVYSVEFLLSAKTKLVHPRQFLNFPPGQWFELRKLQKLKDIAIGKGRSLKDAIAAEKAGKLELPDTPEREREARRCCFSPPRTPTRASRNDSTMSSGPSQQLLEDSYLKQKSGNLENVAPSLSTIKGIDTPTSFAIKPKKLETTTPNENNNGSSFTFRFGTHRASGNLTAQIESCTQQSISQQNGISTREEQPSRSLLKRDLESAEAQSEREQLIRMLNRHIPVRDTALKAHPPALDTAGPNGPFAVPTKADLVRDSKSVNTLQAAQVSTPKPQAWTAQNVPVAGPKMSLHDAIALMDMFTKTNAQSTGLREAIDIIKASVGKTPVTQATLPNGSHDVDQHQSQPDSNVVQSEVDGRVSEVNRSNITTQLQIQQQPEIEEDSFVAVDLHLEPGAQYDKILIGDDRLECQFCLAGKRYKSLNKLNNHLSNKHWFCEKCDEAYVRQEELLHHMLNTPKAHNYCVPCNRDFRMLEGLIRHVNMLHPPETLPVMCPGCKEMCSSAVEVVRHIEAGICKSITKAAFKKSRVVTALVHRYALGPVADCSADDRTEIREQSLKLLAGDNSVVNGLPLVRESAWSPYFDTNRHKVVAHNGQIVFKCPYQDCGNVSFSKPDFIDHLRQGHFSHGVCPGCFKQFHHPSSLMDHIVMGQKNCKISRGVNFPYLIAALSGGYVKAERVDLTGGWTYSPGIAPRAELYMDLPQVTGVPSIQ